MAKPELLVNPKFKRLCRKLGERAQVRMPGLKKSQAFPASFVVGLLECLWIAGQESKNTLIGDETDVEVAAEWPGEPGVLFEVLKNERWIDKKDGRWHIHDFKDHATDYVKRKFNERENKDLGEESPDYVRKNPESVADQSVPPSLPSILTNQPTTRTTARVGDGPASAEEADRVTAGAGVDGDGLDHEIRAYYREHPMLIWDAKAHGSTRQLVEKHGWERAKELIEKGIKKRKRFPASWALGAYDGDDVGTGIDAPAVSPERVRQIARQIAGNGNGNHER
jgi:hypothetical protein